MSGNSFNFGNVICLFNFFNIKYEHSITLTLLGEHEMVLSASLFNSTQIPLAFTPLVINKQTKSEKQIRGR